MYWKSTDQDWLPQDIKDTFIWKSNVQDQFNDKHVVLSTNPGRLSELMTFIQLYVQKDEKKIPVLQLKRAKDKVHAKQKQAVYMKQMKVSKKA